MSDDVQRSEVTEISLPNTIGLETSLEIADDLRRLGPAEPICLDAAVVEQMSTPFVLTLIAAVNDRDDTSPKLQIKNPSAVFTDAFSDLGFFSDMMKMEFTT